MAQGVSATFARIRTLLTATSGWNRAVSTALQDWTDLSDGDIEAVTEQVARAFVLQYAGNVRHGSGDFITEPGGIRRALFLLTLSLYQGGGVGTAGDFGAVNQSMADLVDEVIQVLENPNNQDRTNTGWWAATDFVASDFRLVNGRLTCTVAFEAVYYQAYGAL